MKLNIINILMPVELFHSHATTQVLFY